MTPRPAAKSCPSKARRPQNKLLGVKIVENRPTTLSVIDERVGRFTQLSMIEQTLEAIDQPGVAPPPTALPA